jgi:hypothetical protein
MKEFNLTHHIVSPNAAFISSKRESERFDSRDPVSSTTVSETAAGGAESVPEVMSLAMSLSRHKEGSNARMMAITTPKSSKNKMCLLINVQP